MTYIYPNDRVYLLERVLTDVAAQGKGCKSDMAFTDSQAVGNGQ
ncbi:hypothetical protein [Stenotrophomonas maltophilia]|nr:hypothetical protein [Stenotrophomonas maltophilia]